MRKQKIVSIVGGDERQIYLIKYFLKNGYIVKIIGFENRRIDYSDVIICSDIADAVSNTDYIILGIPAQKEKGFIYAPLSDRKLLTDDLLTFKDKNAVVLGGKITETLEKKAVIDYCENETFAYLNAVPTAEGCIKIIMDKSVITIDGMNCLIIGFGRTAKVLANKLKLLGANITIAARNKKQLGEAFAFGYDICNIKRLNEIICNFDTVINTVPEMIIDKEILSAADNNTLFIDLASLPGGIDFSFAANKGITAVQALGLPAKTAPDTAAEIIYKVITNEFEEENI